MRAAIYTRSAVEMQSDHLDGQLSRCREYAGRQKIEVVATFSDSGKPRDGLAALLIAADKPLFDALVIDSLDRLSRNVMDLMSLLERFEGSGIQILTPAAGSI